MIRGAGIQAVGAMGTSHWVGMGKAWGKEPLSHPCGGSRREVWRLAGRLIRGCIVTSELGYRGPFTAFHHFGVSGD